MALYRYPGQVAESLQRFHDAVGAYGVEFAHIDEDL